MKSVAKIILGFSLLALVACSGKGSGESRIHNVGPDEKETDSPAVIDDDENHGSTPAADTVACSFESGAFCAETAGNAELKAQCSSHGGKVVDKCPEKSKKCNITEEGFEGFTFYINSDLMTCETLEMYLSMEDDGEYEDWED